MATESWEVIAKQKRASNAGKIPAEWRLPESILTKIGPTSDLNVLDIPRTCGILSSREIELTEKYGATELLEKLASREISSYELTLAFCKRAAVTQQLVNCLTEIFFDQALERAKSLDDYLAKNGKTTGPLHGLPISLKDSFNVKGVPTTVGYVSFVKNPPLAYNSAIVEILFRSGAVFYVKTHLPQTMMTADSETPLFGRTLNPNKLSLTAGGSTGGEGALVKMNGSVMGLATDVAGSIRIPALSNGIYGFKPTASRVPFSGNTPPGRLGSPSSILPCIGPQCRNVSDLELFMKTVIESDPWELDQGCIAVPWRKVDGMKRPLRLGLITEHPNRPLHPTMLRTIQEAEHALVEAGHEVISMDKEIPDLWETTAVSWKYFLLDPQRTPVKHVQASGEPWIKSIAQAGGEFSTGWEASLDALWDLNVARSKITKAYHDIIVKHNLDAFIMPPYQATAVPHDTYGVPIYTILSNCLDYPTGSIPFLKADKKLDEKYLQRDVAYEPPYLPDAVEGAPSGIQVVGRPMKDEELLKILNVVDQVLKGHG